MSFLQCSFSLSIYPFNLRKSPFSRRESVDYTWLPCSEVSQKRGVENGTGKHFAEVKAGCLAAVSNRGGFWDPSVLCWQDMDRNPYDFDVWGVWPLVFY